MVLIELLLVRPRQDIGCLERCWQDAVHCRKRTERKPLTLEATCYSPAFPKYSILVSLSFIRHQEPYYRFVFTGFCVMTFEFGSET
jgi:hypothetical protein